MAKKKEKKWIFEFAQRPSRVLITSYGPGQLVGYADNESGDLRIIDDEGDEVGIPTSSGAEWLRDLCQAILDNNALPEE